MSIHDGHRQRIKHRFRSDGLDNFDEIHVLELLLCYCVPRRDTNQLAHDLLKRFGSLSLVLEAPREELEKVPGVGENISTFLSLTTAVCRYYLVNRGASTEILTSDEQFERHYGRRADKIRRLYNGMIKCGYYQFFNNPIRKGYHS